MYPLGRSHDYWTRPRNKRSVARPRKGASVKEELEETITTGRHVVLYASRILEPRLNAFSCSFAIQRNNEWVLEDLSYLKGRVSNWNSKIYIADRCNRYFLVQICENEVSQHIWKRMIRAKVWMSWAQSHEHLRDFCKFLTSHFVSSLLWLLLRFCV